MRPKKTVLCVGADTNRLACQAFLLETRGYRVMEALGGGRALAVIEGSKPGSIDVMVTELEMPDMDGETLTRIAKRLDPSLPVLVLSHRACGYDHTTSSDLFLPRGCHEPAVLLEKIQILASRKRGPKKHLFPAVLIPEKKESVA